MSVVPEDHHARVILDCVAALDPDDRVGTILAALTIELSRFPAGKRRQVVAEAAHALGALVEVTQQGGPA